jgi:hypothetical protein
MFGLYKRSMDEAAGLSALLTLVLLDDEVYKAQRNALIEFTKATPAKDAAELGLAVHSAWCERAHALWKGGSVPLGVPGFLWKARQGEIPPK